MLRRALFAWAFNPGTRNLTPPAETATALEWIAPRRCRSPRWKTPPPSGAPWAPAPAPAAGKPAAAATTQRRKRAVFHNAVGYAVELRHLAANPIDRNQWKAPAVAADRRPPRRRPPCPGHARLLAAVRGLSDRGEHLEAFYGCLYYAYLRPSEAVMLRETDCRCPAAAGAASTSPPPPPRAGTEWTDDGTARQARGLKHRAQHETRSIPIPPVLVQMLRAHLKRYGTGPDGRIFRTAAAGSSRTAPTAPSGPAPAPPRSPPPSTPPRWPDAPTICGTPPSPWR